MIGPRGATQKQLQESSGAKILLRGRGAQKDSSGAPHPDDDDDLHVTVEGTDEAVARAMKEIQQILYNPEQASRLKDSQLQSLAELNGHAGLGYGSDGDYQVELRVPNSMVGLVIGKGGENIHRMQTQTGANMQIAKESEMKPGETLRSIWIKGTPTAVADLKGKVEEIINNRLNGVGTSSGGASRTTTSRDLEHAFLVKLPVPNDKVSTIWDEV